jgi:CheY-like chemotaxis protein
MDGLEFLTQMRADAVLHNTVVFVLTTSGRDADRSKAYQRHIAGYMVKSEVGPQFQKLASLLASYGESVALPEE